MTAIDPPTFQPYVPVDYAAGQLPTRDPITKNLYRIGQTGPGTVRRWNMQHGRYLAGFGSNETQPAYAAKQDEYAQKLENEDDVKGSGIFDSYGRKATVHMDLGVFADHPSLPGYVDREVQFSVSKDVVDITSGADVVVVPAGGMTYQERGGVPVDFDGRTPGNDLKFSRVTSSRDLYASTAPSAAVQTVVQKPGLMVPVPPSVAMRPVGSRDISRVGAPQRGVKLNNVQRFTYSTPAVAPAHAQHATGPMLAPQKALRGFGETPQPIGWGTYAFAGLLVGTAAAMVYGLVK